jgi:hypothetical protein
MASLSVKEQGRRLVAECPSFRPLVECWWLGIWEGEVTPICQKYRIHIRYFPFIYLGNVELAHPHITIRVVDPVIAPDPRGTGEATPHVYSWGHPPATPALCIFDPAQREWGPEEYIVDKIIPWTVKWLLFYEDWLDTGEWQGRGRHPEVAPEARRGKLRKTAPTLQDDVRLSRLFDRFGRRVGLLSSGLALALRAGWEETFDSWPPAIPTV